MNTTTNHMQPAATETGIAWTSESELKRLALLHEHSLQQQREALARLVTFGILAGFGAMIAVTYAVLLLAEDSTYNRAKDLLIFINPLIGIVIGYYFTKGQAEKAEAAAQTAEGEKRVAEGQAAQANAQTKETIGALQTLKDAAQDLMNEPVGNIRAKSLDPHDGIGPGDPPGLGGGGNAALERALVQAEQVLARNK